MNIIVRITGYTGPKIQAVKDIRGFAAEHDAPWQATLRGAKEICDLVDQHGGAEFEIKRMPGAKLALLKLGSGGVQGEIISTSGVTKLEVSGDDVVLLLEALEAYRAVVGLVKSPRAFDCEHLIQTIEAQS